MNQEVKEKWVAALRSGEYSQTTGKLANSSLTEFCCLGVLCDLFSKEFPEQGWWTGKHRYCAVFVVKLKDAEEERDGDKLPASVAKWAEIGTLGDLPREVRGERCLAELNDNGMNFAEIADIIEKEFR